MRHLQQSELKMKSLLLPVPELGVGSQHDLQMPGQVLFAEQFGDAGNALALVA